MHLQICPGFLAAVLFPLAALASPAAAETYQVYNDASVVSSSVLQDPHYHHGATVADYNGKLYVAWNGNDYNSSEGQPGQVIMYRTSADGGKSWSETRIPFVKDYSAVDDVRKARVDATPGNADDGHKIPIKNAIEWQPSLIVFDNKLLVFWGQDRNAPGSALMMSILEPDREQWRSHALYFAPDGSPYFIALSDGQPATTSDTPFVTMSESAAGGNGRTPGISSLPTRLRLKNVDPSHLKDEAVNGAAAAPAADAPIALNGQHLLPTSNQSMTFKDSAGHTVLAVVVILEQTAVDWGNLAIKVPAVLTTTDLEHWQMSVVPLMNGDADFLHDPGGDVGLVSAWEPTLNQDKAGLLHIAFRLNYPPRAEGGASPKGTGYHSAGATGAYTPGQGIQWNTAHVTDWDLPATRFMIAPVARSHRWVMVANNMVQGVSYDSEGRPAFNAERFEPASRRNLTMFFSERGDDDFLSGLGLSNAQTIDPNKEEHYPYVQPAPNGDLLIAYSTHRRTPACLKAGVPYDGRGCGDGIEFMRVRNFPAPDQPAIYPNHFARFFSFGQKAAQQNVYGFNDNVLTLHDRASAGIETSGKSGCVDLHFKWVGSFNGVDDRPVMSFGRTADRASPVGLSLRPGSDGVHLVLGEKDTLAIVPPGAWAQAELCYDFAAGTISSGGASVKVDGALSQDSYLGDPTLRKRTVPLPDLSFDIAKTSLNVTSP